MLHLILKKVHFPKGTLESNKEYKGVNETMKNYRAFDSYELKKTNGSRKC